MVQKKLARMVIQVSAVLVLMLFLSIGRTAAQDKPAVITADNIADLGSVAHIDFASLPADAGVIQSGWFVLSPDGDRMTIKNRDNALVTLDTTGKIIDHFALPGSDGLPTTIEDAAFNPDGTKLASANVEGGRYYILYRSLNTGTMDYYRFNTTDTPLRVWWDSYVWLEVAPVDSSTPRYVLQLNPAVSDQPRQNAVLSNMEMTMFPSGPENDPDAFLRIGRINPPQAITVTQDGATKLWNLETDSVVAQAKTETMPGAGRVSADGHYFAWRDDATNTLNLLDFETGKDRVIASLDSAYVPYILMSASADVIIATHSGDQPGITAWNTATGERYDLGAFRSCNREPDMVRLSKDGTTLMVGCDTGLDIWRVKNQN